LDTLLNWELDLIIQIRNTIPNLVGVFELLTSLGGEMFFLVLLPLIYWCVDRRTGARLTVLFLISAGAPPAPTTSPNCSSTRRVPS